MMVDLKEIQQQASSRPSILQAPTRNLFLAVWQTLGAKPKAKIGAHANMIKKYDPALIWKLLTKYHGTVAQIIRY